MSYLLSFALGVGAFLKKESKLMLFITTGFLVILFSYNTINPDLHNYKMMYEQNVELASEPLFLFVQDIFRSLGLSFVVFRTCLGTFAFTLLAKTFMDFSPYPAAIMLLYFIYPFSIDAVQVRSFVATAISIYTIRYIVFYRREPNVKYIVYYLIWNAVAIGFHYSAIFLLLTMILFANPKKHFVLVYMVTPIVIIILILCIRSLFPYVVDIIGKNKAEDWVSEFRKISKKNLLFLFITRGGLLFLAIFYSMFEKKSGYKKRFFYKKLLVLTDGKVFNDKKAEIDFYDKKTDAVLFMCMAYINLYTLLELLVASDYERLVRVSLILNSIYLSRMIYDTKKQNRFVMWAILVLFYLVYFSTIMFFRSAAGGRLYFNFVFRNVMENNSLIP